MVAVEKQEVRRQGQVEAAIRKTQYRSGLRKVSPLNPALREVLPGKRKHMHVFIQGTAPRHDFFEFK